jgi:bla regulator protein BlaR1
VCDLLRANSIGIDPAGHWKRSLTLASSPSLASLANSAASEIGLKRIPPLYRSSVLPAPVTFGLWRPRIVVPDGIETCQQPEQLQAVLQHEMAHIVRQDLWIGLLQQVAAIVYWWNPLVHGVNRRIADLREQICDDLAVRNLPEPRAYAAVLINLADRCSRSVPVPATLGIGSSPMCQLESRVRRILSSTELRTVSLNRRSLAGVLAAASLMTATILFAQVQVDPSSSGQPNPQSKSEQIDQSTQPGDKAEPKPAVALNPTLHELIQKIAYYEQISVECPPRN